MGNFTHLAVDAIQALLCEVSYWTSNRISGLADTLRMPSHSCAFDNACFFITALMIHWLAAEWGISPKIRSVRWLIYLLPVMIGSTGGHLVGRTRMRSSCRRNINDVFGLMMRAARPANISTSRWSVPWDIYHGMPVPGFWRPALQYHILSSALRPVVNKPAKRSIMHEASRENKQLMATRHPTPVRPAA